jgi:hypothetical protein
MTDQRLSEAKQALLARWREGRAGTIAARPGATLLVSASRARASVQQYELWRLYQQAPRSASSNVSYAGIVDVRLDTAALRSAVELVFRRHEVMRTTMSESGGTVWQDVHDELLATPEEIDLTDLAPDLGVARARKLAEEVSREPFDLATGPLARTQVFSLPDDRTMLAIVAHHAIVDGWSLAVAMREISIGYDALASGRKLVLPPLASQYRDFAEWQWEWMLSSAASEHADFWRERLHGTVAPRLVMDDQVPTGGEGAAGLLPLDLGPELSAGIHRLARAENVTVFAVLLAAFNTVLARQTGRRVVSVGSPVANREHPETLPLIGLFASVVPFQTVVEEEGPFRRLVQASAAAVASSMAHAQYPLPMYLHQVEPGRDPRTAPFYSAVFVLQPPMQPFELGGARMSPVSLDRGAGLGDLSLHLWNDAPSIHGNIGYSTGLRAAAAELAESLKDVLAAGCADAGQPVGRLGSPHPH